MKDSFYGWYFKCQSDAQTLAFIPSLHQSDEKRTCLVQVITDKGAWAVPFPANVFQRKGKTLFLGENRFGKEGIRLRIHTPELSLLGNLDFGVLSPLKYSIMGPFAAVPFMECRHSVWSMEHVVRGNVCINGEQYSFAKGRGYWEGDRGHSFPERYLWTQCFFTGGSLMLSVAEIPMAGFHFTGIIGVIIWKGKEYRLATYLGARIVKIKNGSICIKQGKLELEARLLEAHRQPLQAPIKGKMVRTIHESASCRASYRFCKEGKPLLDFETDRASFEYEYLF